MNILSRVTKRTSAIACLLIFGVVISRAAIAEPILLSETEMDSVSAGYVSLHGNALAHATGEHVSAAAINVDITQQKVVNIEEGIGYTLSTVTANASALGEKVNTSVAAGFETNEQILSLDIKHTTVTQVIAVPAPGPVQPYNSGGKPTAHNPGKSHRNRHTRDTFYRRRLGAARHNHTGRLVVQNETIRLTLVTAQPLNQ